ncbi:hypothetical protein [Mesorhizobium sp.]|uniref:hypothetical protein n=1 Tax=Mesorhizobium sp. TaxID=1871066 RepID=UPI001222872B|nr:MAG: hypothetical protein E5Y82_25410 [Mesorhizobium sp.]
MQNRAFCCLNPELLGDLSISKLVSQTNSGEASVLRFCRTLGLSGFREFRVALPGRLSAIKPGD